MIATSTSFRFEVLPIFGQAVALVADLAIVCAPPTSNSYFCNTNISSQNLNANTTDSSWTFIQDVNSGGRGTVQFYGKLGDEELGANVTLAVLPDGYTLGNGSDLPWMAAWVKCRGLPLATSY
jgi:hypothetical protein